MIISPVLKIESFIFTNEEFEAEPGRKYYQKWGQAPYTIPSLTAEEIEVIFTSMEKYD